MSDASHRIGKLVLRVQDAFLDTPELTLTPRQAHERFGVDEATCEAILGARADARVLSMTPDGAFVCFFPRAAMPSARFRTLHQQPSRRRGVIRGRAGQTAWDSHADSAHPTSH